MNIGSDKKVWEKLDSTHNSPVKRGLVEKAGDWPWSSWRFYYLAAAAAASRRKDLSCGWRSYP